MMEGIKTNSLQAWWLASRPKTLTGAVAPVLVGGAMAFSMVATRTFGANYFSTAEEAFFSWLPEMLAPCALCLLFAMLMQFDARTQERRQGRATHPHQVGRTEHQGHQLSHPLHRLRFFIAPKYRKQ